MFKFFSKPNVVNSLYAIIDQGVLSLSSFILNLFLIQYASQKDYGVYVIIISFFLLFSGLQNAIVNSPLTTIFPTLKNEEEKNTYSKTLLLTNILFMLVLLFLFFPFFPSIFKKYYSYDVDHFSTLILFFSLIIYLTREFCRNIFYAKLQSKTALFFDISYFIILIVCVVIVLKFKLINPIIIIFIIGLSSLFGIACFIKHFKKTFYSVKNFQEVIPKIWQYSKWALIGVISSWLNMNAYIYLTSDTVEIAKVSAARIFIMPIILVLSGFGTYLKPLVSNKLSENNYTSIKKIIKYGTFTLFIVMLIYGFLVYVFYEIFGKEILPNTYMGIENYIILWSIFAIVSVFYTISSNVLLSFLQYKFLSIIGIIMVLSTFLFSFLLYNSYGIIGIISVISLSMFLASLLGSIRLYKFFKNEQS